MPIHYFLAPGWLLAAAAEMALFSTQPLPQAQALPAVTAVPAELSRSLKLSSFYKKHASADGLPVLSSARVSDRALQEAAAIIHSMLKNRQDLLQAIIQHKVRCVVMAPEEMTTDVPEHSDLKPKEYWNRRARGLGATRSRPAVSCGEENLLHLPGDRYPRENILVHEFAHVIHELGLNSIDPRFEPRLKAAYTRAVKEGLWKGTYAASNFKEYWAEGVQSYFDCNAPRGWEHNGIAAREQLENYDPVLFQLLAEVFRQTDWRYPRALLRPRQQ